MSAVPAPSAAARAKLTYEDYAALPDDGRRYELHDGEIELTPAPTLRHQKVSRRLHFALYQALELTGRGEVYSAPTDVVLHPQVVVEPDLLYVSTERSSLLADGRFVNGAPDLVIEILSASTRRKDILAKGRLYAQHGVPHYWTVDPEIDRVECLVLRDGAYALAGRADAPDTLHPPSFEGVAIDLGALFAE